jgi:hypothetical protein
MTPPHPPNSNILLENIYFEELHQNVNPPIMNIPLVSYFLFLYYVTGHRKHDEKNQSEN